MTKLRREEIEEAKRLKKVLNREFPRVFFHDVNVVAFKRLIDNGYAQYSNGTNHKDGCELGILGEKELDLFIKTGETKTEREKKEAEIKEEKKEKREIELMEIARRANRISILAIMTSLAALITSILLK